MNYKQHIEDVINYIENNLKNEITVEELACTAGYSKYHFLRVFNEVVKLTPADYIRKRRLSEIANEIMTTARPISEIAFGYGFNSKENFTRAFKAEHNVLPTEYKKAGNSLKLFDRFRLDSAPFEVTPEIMKIDGFSLTVFENNESHAPNFWNLYNCKKLSLRLSGGKVCADYGVCYWNYKKNKLDYFIGIKTSDACGDTSGTIQLEIPGDLYAVFSTPPASHFDFVNTIHRTWGYILNVWIPRSRYIIKPGYQFETYIEASRTFSENIYIPIEKK